MNYFKKESFRKNFPETTSHELQSLLEWGTSQLKKIENPAKETQYLLSFILKKDLTFLHLNPKRKITFHDRKIFKKLIEKRKKNIPLAYLTGKKEFWGLLFRVNKHTLIPRPESEILVEKTLRHLDKNFSPDREWVIADIGTGSGCLAVSLYASLKNPQIISHTYSFHNLPPIDKVKIYATDCSSRALNIAQKNAQRILGKNSIKFLRGNLHQPLPEKTDIVIANLPYLSAEEYQECPLEVKREPLSALYGGPEGTELIQEMISKNQIFLKPQGKIFYETTHGQIRTFNN